MKKLLSAPKAGFGMIGTNWTWK